MAAMIGRGKSWLWWLAGLFCALVFGRSGVAGEQAEQPVYGVRVDPGFIAPVAPKPRHPADDEARRKAGQLIEQYLASQNPPPAGDELKARIDKLIKDLGANEWDVREKASKELSGIGRPSLDALKEAARSKDPEVAQRAADLAAGIADDKATLEQLRDMGATGLLALQERLATERKAVTGKAGAAGEADLAGRKDEAEKLRAEAKQAQANVAALVKLAALLAQSVPGSGPVSARYGVRMVIERD